MRSTGDLLFSERDPDVGEMATFVVKKRSA